MGIIALDHVQLAMPIGKEDQARQFFCDILGFVEVAKPPMMAARGGIWLVSGSVNLHLGVEKEFIPAKKAHVALIVEDYINLIDRLTHRNFPIKHDAELAGVRRFFTEDCFGNRIEIIDFQSPNTQ